MADNLLFSECLIKCPYKEMTVRRPALPLPYSVYLPSAKLSTDTTGLQSHRAVSDQLQKAGRSANIRVVLKV